MNRRPTLALSLGVFAISFAAIFFRETSPTHPLVAAGLRLAIAAALLSPFVWRGRAALRPLRGDALLGGALYALHFGSWVTSLTLTSVAASVTLVTATPLLLALVASFTRRDRPSKRQWVAIGIAMLGLSILGGVDLDSPSALAGDALALLGAAAMAGYLLVVRRHGAHLDVLAFSGVSCAVGAALLLSAALAFGVAIEVPTTEAWIYIVLAALIPQILGHGMLTWALRHVSPTAVGLATVVEPVGATLLAWAWLGESVGLWVMVGCAITLTAVLVSYPRAAKVSSGA